jgi:hypothetical protein
MTSPYAEYPMLPPPDMMRRGEPTVARSLVAASVVMVACVVCYPFLSSSPYLGTKVVGSAGIISLGLAMWIKYEGRFTMNFETSFIAGMLIQYMIAPLFLRIFTDDFQDYFGQTAERVDVKEAYAGAMLVVLIFAAAFLVTAALLPKRAPVRWSDGRLAVAFSKRAYVVMAVLTVQLWMMRAALLASGSFYTLNRSKFQFEDPRFSAWAQFTSGVGPVVLAFLWSAYLAKKLPAPFVLAYTAVEFFWNFSSGSREQTLIVLITILVAYIIYRNRFPWKSCAIALLPILGLIGFMDHYRYALIHTTEANKINLSGLSSAVSTAMEGSSREGARGTVLHGLSRVNDLESVAAIYRWTPSMQPYLGGETYWRVLPALVPRQLWPDKPTTIMPINEWFFAHEGGSSPTTIMGEGYLNFGWPGVIAAGVLCAFIVQGLESLIVRLLWNGTVMPVYIGSMAIIARMQTQALAVWVTALLKILLLVWMVHVFARPRPEALFEARGGAGYGHPPEPAT